MGLQHGPQVRVPLLLLLLLLLVLHLHHSWLAQGCCCRRQ
jgi:hypothetical protein